MHSTTHSPGRRAARAAISRDGAFRLALVALILAGLLASCSGLGTGANRALDRVRDFGDRFDAVAERFMAPVREAVQGMARSLRSVFDGLARRFPR